MSLPTIHVPPVLLRPFPTVLSVYRESLQFARHAPCKLDVVIDYSLYGVALAALLVSLLLGVLLIIQAQNDLGAANAAQGQSLRLRRFLAKRLARFVHGRADGWHLNFESQMGEIAPRSYQQVFYLTVFMPVSSVPVQTMERKEFLMLGHPGSVKGVEPAIRTFRAAVSALAVWRLRIVGHCSDRTPHEALARGDSRTQFKGGMPQKDALLPTLNRGVCVIASNIAACGLRAIETIAALRPLIGTREGSVPTPDTNEQAGLSVDPGNVEQLSAATDRLRGGETLRRGLKTEAGSRVDAEHIASPWVENFVRMVERAAVAQR